MQRNKNRSIIFELHSIPIKIRSLCTNAQKYFRKNSLGISKRLYLVSYSIPLSCMVVLLLVMGMSIGTWSSYSDVAYAEEGISTHIDVAHPTIAMDVSRNTSDGYGNEVAGQVTTAPGAGTAYRSHKVTVTGSDIQDYQLTISGPSELTPSSGAATVVSGAGGKTGEEMSNSNSNIWGYAWGEDKDEVTGMVYNTMTDAGSNLDCTSPSADYKVNCERKLVFAANFANNATGGTYTAEVQLSLVATPHLVGQAWSDGKDFTLDTGIDDMQDIDKVDGGFCKASIPAGSTITLRDGRGEVENFYKIIKMNDGTCWMAENLRLINTKITKDDSDITSADGFTIPISDISGFHSERYGDTYFGDQYQPKAYYDNNKTYGAYYNWYTATAGAGNEYVKNTDINNSSICPKNWKLPAYEGVGSFNNIVYGFKSTWLTGTTAIKGYNGYKLGYDSDYAFWPAAGNICNSSLSNAGSGFYWSRRASFSVDYAYILFFYYKDVTPQYSSGRACGSSVRCVANY